ncbi:hypothetical protein L3Q82_002047 [Scortum barcoo]|uniref:Uncharacterized protein n=1 Tax=Scortum barcoo TaxID=214431 RepID=A0ACB8W1Y4_9TELE|nr:hypothetical protein L3Q82_002047 [Scortum barcoo]
MISVTTKAKEILSHAGMNLCKWITNSPELRAKWTERGMEHTTETATCGNVLKVLGLVWRSEKDDFVINSLIKPIKPPPPRNKSRLLHPLPARLSVLPPSNLPLTSPAAAPRPPPGPIACRLSALPARRCRLRLLSSRCSASPACQCGPAPRTGHDFILPPEPSDCAIDLLHGTLPQRDTLHMLR